MSLTVNEKFTCVFGHFNKIDFHLYNGSELQLSHHYAVLPPEAVNTTIKPELYPAIGSRAATILRPQAGKLWSEKQLDIDIDRSAISQALLDLHKQVMHGVSWSRFVNSLFNAEEMPGRPLAGHFTINLLRRTILCRQHTVLERRYLASLPASPEQEQAPAAGIVEPPTQQLLPVCIIGEFWVGGFVLKPPPVAVCGPETIPLLEYVLPETDTDWRQYGLAAQ